MTWNDTENSVLVVDGSFAHARPDEFVFIPFDPIGGTSNRAIDLPSDVDPHEHTGALLSALAIRIAFPSSHDGRGFSIASALRQHGYRGHLRAYGRVVADQYPLALRTGFDDVEISRELAERQPEEQWRDALTRTESTYQQRLRSRFHRAA